MTDKLADLVVEDLAKKYEESLLAKIG